MNPTPPALSTFVPPLPEALVANLATLGIKTAPDLIFAPLATLMRQLPPGSITYAELMQHVAHVTEAFAGPVITGDKLLAEADSRVQLGSVQSGLPALDALLDHNSGGESSGRVVEISGSGGSGKTALALHIVLNHLESHQPNAALWIDTTGDLAPARLTALASHSHEGPAAEDILSRLNIVSVFDIEAVVRTIEALDSDSAPQVPRFRIVVLDTVTALLGPRLSGLSSQGSRMPLTRLLIGH
ncbi:hypothetical protein BC834DRAFT_822097 [Gloeopeniophorella convolvens]|nr:hypothetical protein BC834DRAFT_822097 [Gloeopeniophorella convolvens]